MKVIFICRRNRFRSQIAEGIFNHLIKDDSSAISAGVDTLPEEHGVLFGEYKNEKVKNTIEAMKNHGIDISKKYAKRITPEMLENVDKIILLTDNGEEIIDLLLEYPYEHWKIENFPGSPTLEKSEETIQILENKIRSMLK
ncbi:MAG: low molecular weight phosphatase family protein [Candidatus Parcubacteria bacterium]|nr:low molecular weight phosphatase family protein [Candidatus Parcubacteria bacterium]